VGTLGQREINPDLATIYVYAVASFFSFGGVGYILEINESKTTRTS